jgi:photosystem II stability/assembly factor-like uncharacterized protein
MEMAAPNQAARLAVLLVICGAPAIFGGPNQWTRLGQNTGTVTALALDPGTEGTLYAAAGASLFKSTDGGLTWAALSAPPPCCVSALVIDPQNAATIYAVSGAAGIFKSPDGGGSWSPANSGLPVDNAGNVGVTSLAMNPQDSSTLYAGIGRQGAGLFQSTDGGASWTPASPGLPDGAVMALALDPQSPNTIYVSTLTSGVFQSMDGGATWASINNGLGFSINDGYDYISVLAVDPHDSSVLYTAPHYGSSTDDSALFVSTDAGADWHAVNALSISDEDTGVGIIVAALASDPNNPGTVYAGSSAGIYLSTDFGASWTAAKTRATSDADSPLSVSALAVDPLVADSVYAAVVSEGILETTDSGASWITVNSDLREAAPPQIADLRNDPQNPGTLFARTAENGLFKSIDAGASWIAVNAGLPGPVFELPVSVLEVGTGVLYAVDPYWEDIFHSADGGISWATSLALDANGLVVRGARLEANALALDPGDPRTIYMAGSYWQNGSQIGPTHGVYQSTNGGASWSWAGSGLPVSSADQSQFIGSLAIDPGNPGTIYAGTATQGLMARSSGVFKTTNGGATWKAAGLGGGFSRVDILAIDPQHTETVYARAILWPPDAAGCCGWLFKTTDGGTTWAAANSGLPNYVTAFAIDPQNPGTLYVGTHAGVYRSVDGGANWTPVNDGLTSLSVTALAIDSQDSNTVYAATADGLFGATFFP